MRDKSLTILDCYGEEKGVCVDNNVSKAEPERRNGRVVGILTIIQGLYLSGKSGCGYLMMKSCGKGSLGTAQYSRNQLQNISLLSLPLARELISTYSPQMHTRKHAHMHTNIVGERGYLVTCTTECTQLKGVFHI